MKHFAILCSAVLALLATSPTASADCTTALAAASKSMASDKNCQKGAKSVFGSFKKQVSKCKGFRKLKKQCRKEKRAIKRKCRKKKRSCLKKCKKLKNGKSRCRRRCRKAKRRCFRAARRNKRACKKEALSTREFKTCKNARRLTRKSSGRFFKCAAKHYKGAALVCSAELASALAGGGGGS